MSPLPHNDRRTVVLEDEGLRSLQGFTQIPNAVLKHPALSFGAKITYGILLSYAWQDDFCWPAQDRIAIDLNCSDRWVRKLLVELRDAGAIRWRQQGLNKPNVYYIRSLSDWLTTVPSNRKDRNDSSAPDRNDSAAQDRINSSDEVYPIKNIQPVNVTGFEEPVDKRTEEVRAALMVEEMLEALGDRQSTGLYRRLAQTLPEDVIYQALAETREIASSGRIRKNKGAYFTAAIRRLADQRGYDPGLRTLQ